MCILGLLQHLQQAYGQGDCLKGRVGIITPYKAQVRLLKSTLSPYLHRLGLKAPGDLEVNTVDAYQGREKDIIVISCVRSNPQGSLGFLTDHRRMNVAITRARHCLFVVGNSATLEKDSVWKAFIDHSKPAGYKCFGPVENWRKTIGDSFC